MSLKKGSRYRIVITAITENMKQSESLIGDFETSKEIEDEVSTANISSIIQLIINFLDKLFYVWL